MREDFLRKIFIFFFRYLWLVCGLMITINFTGMMITAYSIMQTSAEEALTSISTELSHRIHVNFELLNGLKSLPQLSDTSIDVRDRAASLKPFAKAFSIWMIGIVDPDGMISSTYKYSSARVTRDYIPRIVASKQPEMTDVFPAGATGDLNYTQLMPIIRDGKVISIVFTATLLTQINELLERKLYESPGYYLLLDSKCDVISHPSHTVRSQSLLTLTEQEDFLSKQAKDLFISNIKNQIPGAYISLYNNSLYYTTYMPVAGTKWTAIYRIRIVQTFQATLIGFGIQTFLYLLIFATLSFFFSKDVYRRLEPVNNMLKQVIDLNKEIHNSDILSHEDAQSILNLSKKGLKDELTELPTRMLFRQMLNIRLQNSRKDTISAVFYIDMDNLKSINDTFGHKHGDEALISMAKTLQAIAHQYDGICARYGGDEFMLFVDSLHKKEDVHPIATALLQSLAGKVELNGETRSFHASIGISLYPLHAKSIDVVIQLADIALYEVKQNGKAGYAIYQPENAPTSPANKPGSFTLTKLFLS